jgi:hypothetical protein
MSMHCTQMRRMLVRRGRLDVHGKVKVEPESANWVTTECHIPLFTDQDRERGKCEACFTGWTHYLNFPVEDNEDEDI